MNQHLLVPLLLHIVQSLNETARRGQTPGENLHQKAEVVGDTVFAALPQVVEAFELLHNNVAADLALATDPTGAAALLKSAGWLSKLMQKAGAPRTTLKKDFRFTTDGRFYYNFHAALKDVTRPSGRSAVLEGIKLSKGLRINFVIFIDDLDRCLPDKAVETLELIKTVFNLESFAFVLALDEEVVERGIGHRYKDYALQNKKPEMPITGFEYLEKIVHLPFRLPALSRREAMEFLEAYEHELLGQSVARRTGGYEAVAWFAEREGGDFARFHLGHAVVNAFDAYVPRKLIRVVELFHQVAEVAHARGRPVDNHLGSERDPRMVLVFVMLQLFHPDLYRLMRRQGLGVDILRDSFFDGLLRPDMADMDLMAWACYQTQPVPDLASAMEAIAAFKDDEGKRYPAQRLRLPIAERLLEHRAVQRHVFDPLKLFAGLIHDDAPFSLASTRGYFSLLGQVPDETDVLSPLPVHWPVSARGEDFPLGIEVNGEHLFVTLTSAEPSERRALASALGLKQGQKLSSLQVQALIGRTTKWLKAEGPDPSERLLRLQDGLSYLAPFIDAADGPALWALSKLDKPNWERAAPFRDIKALKQAAHAADLYAALGLDERFDPDRFHLPATRWKSNSPELEPLEGFVQVVSEASRDSQDIWVISGQSIKLDPFAMARYLTTVDQYAHFVDDGGYGDPDEPRPEWWSELGWQWRTGQFDNSLRSPRLRVWFSKRPPGESRDCPPKWNEQLMHRGRPVFLTKFEAAAYGSWLTKRLQEKGVLGFGQMLRLPTETEWMRTFCAAQSGQYDSRVYPWGGDDESDVHLRANIFGSRLGEPCITGLFAPNPLGIFDLCGNTFEWQINPRIVEGESRFSLYDASSSMRESLLDLAIPSLRGGSFGSSPAFSSLGIRDGYPPGSIFDFVGFRLVLSAGELTVK